MRRWRFALTEAFALAVLALVVVVASSGLRVVRVDGASMAPALVPGDVVVVGRGQTPRPGEIALFRRVGEPRPTLHRVVAVDERELVTCGDANSVVDLQVVAPAEVWGTVRIVIPFGSLARRVRTAL